MSDDLWLLSVLVSKDCVDSLPVNVVADSLVVIVDTVVNGPTVQTIRCRQNSHMLNKPNPYYNDDVRRP